MKKNEIIFWSLKVPLDFVIVFSSFFIAREIRLITDLIPNINLPIQTIDTNSLFIYAIIWASLQVILFSMHSMYFIKISNSKIKELLEIIRYSFYSFIFFWVIVYLWQWFIFNKEIPRLIIAFSFLLWSIWIIIERVFLNNLQFFLINKWFIAKKKILIINNKSYIEIKNIIKNIKKSKIYKLVWYINKSDNKIDEIQYLWTINEIQKVLKINKQMKYYILIVIFRKKNYLNYGNYQEYFE